MYAGGGVTSQFSNTEMNAAIYYVQPLTHLLNVQLHGSKKVAEGSRTGTCDLYGIFFSKIKCRLHDTKWKSNISIYFSDMGIFHKLEKTSSNPHCLLLAVSFGKGGVGTSHLPSLGRCSHLELQGS